MSPAQTQQMIVFVIILQFWLVLFGLVVFFSILRQRNLRQRQHLATISSDVRSTQSAYRVTSENPAIPRIFEHTAISEKPILNISAGSGAVAENAEATSIIKARAKLKQSKDSLAS